MRPRAMMSLAPTICQFAWKATSLSCRLHLGHRHRGKVFLCREVECEMVMFLGCLLLWVEQSFKSRSGLHFHLTGTQNWCVTAMLLPICHCRSSYGFHKGKTIRWAGFKRPLRAVPEPMLDASCFVRIERAPEKETETGSASPRAYLLPHRKLG